MGIDNFPVYKPGDIIDLSRFEKDKREKELTKEKNLEAYIPLLNELLGNIAEKNNVDFPGFLDSDNRISVNGADLEKDIASINKVESSFSRREGLSREVWSRNKEKDPSNLTEIAITILLNKVLGDDFIVARSSKFDDYKHGVDQVIIYKPSGEVVCGIDEVILKTGDHDSESKSEKLQKIMESGGATVKYGARLDSSVVKTAEKKYDIKDHLVRSHVSNVPAFYMAISKLELGELLENIKNSPNQISEFEWKTFNKLFESLESQASKQNLEGDLKIKTESMLAKFKEAKEQ